MTVTTKRPNAILDARNAVRALSDGDITKLMGCLIARDPAAVLDAIDAMQERDALFKVQS